MSTFLPFSNVETPTHPYQRASIFRCSYIFPICLLFLLFIYWIVKQKSLAYNFTRFHVAIDYHSLHSWNLIRPWITIVSWGKILLTLVSKFLILLSCLPCACIYSHSRSFLDMQWYLYLQTIIHGCWFFTSIRPVTFYSWDSLCHSVFYHWW